MVFLVLAPNTVFTNILGLKRNMDSLPRGTSVCVDFSKTHIVMTFYARNS